MTFLQIQQAVYRRIKLPDSPSSGDSTRIKQFINQRYRKVLSRPGMDQFRDTTFTFATVASQKKYGLPQALSRVRDIYDVTNQRRIFPQTLDWLRNVDPGLSSSSTYTEFWIPLNGWGAIAQELTSTGVGLWAVSDSASDTTQRAYVETQRLGGVRAGTAVSAGTVLTGTARVQIGTLTDHVEVVKFFLDVVPVGNVSLYDAASSGNLLSTITIGRTNARYYMLQLYPTPGAAVTLSVDAQRAIEDLVKDTEEPLFPEDYHMVLVHGAAYDEWRNRDDSRAQGELEEMNALIGELRHMVMASPDAIPVQRGSRGDIDRPSRLGGYYPPGS